MDCIVKICTNLCCVITALFDIRPSNPVPLPYAIGIKTVKCIKHPEFIKWHNNVTIRVPQLLYIYLNMLHKVLFHLSIFSTYWANNSLVKHGNNGAKLTITIVSKIVKFVARFLNNIENHITEGSFPDSILLFTPLDVNPKLLQVANVVAPINTLLLWRSSLILCLQELPLVNVSPKRRKLNLMLDPKTSQRWDYFVARKRL
jgi:hypothetical protein